MRTRRSRFAPATLVVLLLGGCAGALSHIDQQRLFDEAYAGFPPSFDDARLNDLRSRYLAEKPVYDADPDAFLGVGAQGKDCVLPEDVVRALAEGSFRLPIYERSPSWRDYMKKQGHDYGEPVYDAVTLKLIEGDCTGGALNGPASIVLTYLRLAEQEAFRASGQQYKVYETTVRENCAYRRSQRDGECARYTRMRVWDGRIDGSGQVVPVLWAMHEANPDVIDQPEEEDYVDVTTVFDYGRHAHGIEAGPGVAFETKPIVGDGVTALENHTLTRMGEPDGRVRYVEYYGGTRKLTYLLRDGVAHGEHFTFEPTPGEDQRECFVDGALVLTRNCGA